MICSCGPSGPTPARNERQSGRGQTPTDTAGGGGMSVWSSGSAHNERASTAMGEDGSVDRGGGGHCSLCWIAKCMERAVLQCTFRTNTAPKTGQKSFVPM